jgi:hypothetical protein
MEFVGFAFFGVGVGASKKPERAAEDRRGPCPCTCQWFFFLLHLHVSFFCSSLGRRLRGVLEQRCGSPIQYAAQQKSITIYRLVGCMRLWEVFWGVARAPPPGAARRARTGLASRPPCGAKPLFWPSEGTGVGRCAGPPRRPGDWDWGPRALARYRLQDAIPN